MTSKRTVFFFLLPVVLSFFLHVYVLKQELRGYHVWRQAQTQTVIYNYCFTDNSIFHPQRFDLTEGTRYVLYEFPLYQWLVAQVDRIFGYSVTWSRLGSFVVFVVLLLGFFRLLGNFFTVEIALITNVFVCFSPILYYYCICPMPDILALCFSIWSLVFFFRYLIDRHWISFLWFCLFLCLATLVKLPYLLFGGVFVYLIYKKRTGNGRQPIALISIIFLLFLLPAFAWYAYAIPTWKNNPVTGGIFDTDKSFLYLLDCFQFNLFSTVPEVIANYSCLFLLLYGIYLFFIKRRLISETKNYFILLFILFSAYFLFELSAIEKVHDYYLMPFIPLIFLVIAYGAKGMYAGKYKWLLFVFILATPMTAWLRMDHRWRDQPAGALKDYLSDQAAIQNIIPRKALCIVDDDNSRYVSLYYLKRNGYSVSQGHMNPEKLKELYAKGANYLVSENGKDYSEEFKDFEVLELFHKDLRIFKLKQK